MTVESGEIMSTMAALRTDCTASEEGRAFVFFIFLFDTTGFELSHVMNPELHAVPFRKGLLCLRIPHGGAESAVCKKVLHQHFVALQSNRRRVGNEM